MNRQDGSEDEGDEALVELQSPAPALRASTQPVILSMLAAAEWLGARDSKGRRNQTTNQYAFDPSPHDRGAYSPRAKL
ncbi:hypothetical protein CVT26_002857 [Gymnopilus dilepis]|uniref:Uncharacterized protein n=1 Tax=Gymnopilus dilepis TaxID=231916 RepID=A0A409Y325_9AGAR|nr:hypothetical protein CVT26_002857 [Gymnopilus dilepis]